jgi:hypothetical protein
VGRTVPSWRIVVEVELEKLRKIRPFLRQQDRIIFDDLLDQCRLYASFASTMASPVREIPLIISMLFGQHKRLVELEKRIDQLSSRKMEA